MFCYRRNREVSESEQQLHDKITLIMEKYIENMENYSYFGANNGIPEGQIEYIIDEIIELVGH